MEKTFLAVGLMMLLGASFFLDNTLEVSDETNKATLFDNWKTMYNIQYPNKIDERYRLQVFIENLNYINAFNQSPEKKTYTLGLNQFADLSKEEFEEIYLKLRVPNSDNINPKDKNFKYTEGAIDWTDGSKIIYPDIKHQGKCGSCWAFATIGAIEMKSQLVYKTLYTLSEQELIDCSGQYGNLGCDGGWISNAVEYVAIRGLSDIKDYPYTGVDGVCKWNRRSFIHFVTTIRIDGCERLAFSLSYDIIPVYVDATLWQFYKNGILTTCDKKLNHAVIVVGISSDGVWKVRNSWGAAWGEAGHIRLAQGDTCGICMAPEIVSLH
ncbi:unnamed protein product [Paramecium pentaurelia]|uniref:Uncharacterized protein n=1 Tax=Paramecium pentaurelia TaxID=43138 RepID=A0A8S1TNW5_9CILI|nr:unnamed protein product [Paramecium pentaurelia]